MQLLPERSVRSPSSYGMDGGLSPGPDAWVPVRAAPEDVFGPPRLLLRDGRAVRAASGALRPDPPTGARERRPIHRLGGGLVRGQRAGRRRDGRGRPPARGVRRHRVRRRPGSGRPDGPGIPLVKRCQPAARCPLVHRRPARAGAARRLRRDARTGRPRRPSELFSAAVMAWSAIVQSGGQAWPIWPSSTCSVSKAARPTARSRGPT